MLQLQLAKSCLFRGRLCCSSCGVIRYVVIVASAVSWQLYSARSSSLTGSFEHVTITSMTAFTSVALLNEVGFEIQGNSQLSDCSSVIEGSKADFICLHGFTLYTACSTQFKCSQHLSPAAVHNADQCLYL